MVCGFPNLELKNYVGVSGCGNACCCLCNYSDAERGSGRLVMLAPGSPARVSRPVTGCADRSPALSIIHYGSR